jgi:hypothetical protein
MKITNYIITLYVAMNPDKSGPAYGIGTSPEAAITDAAKYGFSAEDCATFEVTPNSYAEIMAGNPDAVDFAA